jgi:hypothetical protein
MKFSKSSFAEKTAMILHQNQKRYSKQFDKNNEKEDKRK